MPSNSYVKTHAVSVIAAVAIPAERFVSYEGTLAAGLGGNNDALGVSEYAANPGDALPLITHFSAGVEAGGNFARGDYVKPGANGVAVLGSQTDHCGRALAAGALGRIVEIQLLRHTRP